MQAFGLTKMQLLKIVLLLSVFVLSSVVARGNYASLGHFSLTNVFRCVIKGLDSRTNYFSTRASALMFIISYFLLL